jgi:AraC-like DNA-binding protein
MLEKDFTRIPNSFIRTQKYLSDKAVKVMNYICSCINSEDAKNGDEKSFPSLETIAENVGFSQSTVSRKIKELLVFNLLEKERKFNKSNHYRLGKGLTTEEEIKEAVQRITNNKKGDINRLIHRVTVNHPPCHGEPSTVSRLTNKTNKQDEVNKTNYSKESETKETSFPTFQKEDIDSLKDITKEDFIKSIGEDESIFTTSSTPESVEEKNQRLTIEERHKKVMESHKLDKPVKFRINTNFALWKLGKLTDNQLENSLVMVGY